MSKKQFKNILLFVWAVLFQTIILSQIKIHKHLTTENGLISNRVISMLEDSKGYLWIGTDNGVSKWDGNSFKNYQIRDGLAAAQVFDIKEDSKGIIYFATYGKGITYKKNDSLFVLNKQNELSSNWMT